MRHFFINKKSMMSSVFFVSFILLSHHVKAAELECRMNFNLKSWSFLYKSGKGTGQVTCNNGQRFNVRLRGQGGGLTVGKSEIIDGLGVFSGMSNVSELYGNYANAEAHAGIGGSASARVMTKENVSLTLTGTGEGVDLGINFGNFKISKM